jgi:hypothetical protein
VKSGLTSGVLDLAEEGQRVVLQAASILVDVDQVTICLHQRLVGLTEGCGVDVILNPLVRRDSIHERFQAPVVTR